MHSFAKDDTLIITKEDIMKIAFVITFLLAALNIVTGNSFSWWVVAMPYIFVYSKIMVIAGVNLVLAILLFVFAALNGEAGSTWKAMKEGVKEGLK
ncbi:hypothetical protein R21_115 [Klebsiella phage R2_1]|nr:hypothetical protein R21_115 [Klebsiella phage R2_1]